jgi:uncharacterized membrane protein
MASFYNRIAGQSLERVSALSDGIFAVAMTILVLDIHAPTAQAIHDERGLLIAVAALAPRFAMYLMSFLTLGIFWIGQQTQINQLSSANRDLSWIHIAFLAMISLMPFSTSLLAEFITYRSALLVYWVNILLPGVLLYLGWRYAKHAKLVREDADQAIVCAIEGRIMAAQGLYAFGAALCLINTYLSIAFIVTVQLNYALAPGWRFRRRK